MIVILILHLIGSAANSADLNVSEKLAGLFSTFDYPTEAKQNDWQGDVTVKVHVGIDGKVHSCRIAKSSGHPVLDLQTCAIMLGRARFAPARDRFDNAVEDDFELPAIRWRLDDVSAGQ